jgi:dephospho-CoA kinase
LDDAEYNVMVEMHDLLSKHLKVGIDLIVYLRTSPEVAWQRLKARDQCHKFLEIFSPRKRWREKNGNFSNQNATTNAEINCHNT